MHTTLCKGPPLGCSISSGHSTAYPVGGCAKCAAHLRMNSSPWMAMMARRCVPRGYATTTRVDHTYCDYKQTSLKTQIAAWICNHPRPHPPVSSHAPSLAAEGPPSHIRVRQSPSEVEEARGAGGGRRSCGWWWWWL